MDRPSFQDIMTSLRALAIKAPLQNYRENVRAEAPTGRVYIVVTVLDPADPLFGSNSVFRMYNWHTRYGKLYQGIWNKQSVRKFNSKKKK